MRILLVSDAWRPQVNGVVRTLAMMQSELTLLGHEPFLITPDQFRTVPLPGYREIALALRPRSRLEARAAEIAPQAIHILTEGPLGWAARRHCLKRGLPFTTSFHTKFPEYVHARIGLPVDWSYALLRRFHAPAVRTMVASASVRRDLALRGFAHLVEWTRGVDSELFRPRAKDFLPGPRPLWLYVGRIAVEKSVEDFLRLDLPGTKYVVGEGPLRANLERRYPEARFVGLRSGLDLARHYAAADVFVFPSRTDTFGNVLLEALAAGTPVAAYPVAGPRDVLAAMAPHEPVGVLAPDLRQAALAALAIPSRRCRDYALGRSWRTSAEEFLGHLAPLAPAVRERAGAPARGGALGSSSRGNR